MTQFKNVLIFHQRPSTGSAEDYQIGMALTAWLMYVQAVYRNPQTGDFHVPVVQSPVEFRPGKTYHKWLKMGVLIHVSGFDYANHFVKLPISFLSQTHHTETSTDEEGNDITITVTNEEYYAQRLIKNETHCLVWIKDSWYKDLKEHITYADDEVTPTNIIAEAEYFDAIGEGGEFYVEPEPVNE